MTVPQRPGWLTHEGAGQGREEAPRASLSSFSDLLKLAPPKLESGTETPDTEGPSE